MQSGVSADPKVDRADTYVNETTCSHFSVGRPSSFDLDQAPALTREQNKIMYTKRGA